MDSAPRKQRFWVSMIEWLKSLPWGGRKRVEIAALRLRVAQLEQKLDANAVYREVLTKSEERYRDLSENTSDWIWEVDAELRFTYANPRLHDLLGYAPAEIMGRRPFDLMPEYEFARLRPIIESLIENPRAFQNAEDEHIRKDGSIRTLETSAVPIFDAAGRFAGYRGIGRDITERRAMQEALRLSAERFSLVSQAANDAIYDLNLQSGEAWVNEAYVSILGLVPPRADLDWWRARVHPDDLGRIWVSFRAALAEQLESWSAEYRVTLQDGRPVDILDRCRLSYDETGAPLRLVGSMIDMTERCRIEKALQKSEILYRTLAEMMDDVVWTTDRDLRVTYISPSVAKALGYTQQERLGDYALAIMTAESIEYALAILSKELARDGEAGVDPDRTVSFETAYTHGNGSVVWFENLASLIRDPHGHVTGVHGVSRDISARRRAALERERLIDELTQALADVKVLSGLLPICSSCKKIRDDKGYWNQIESYISEHSQALFSHGICPDCAKKLYPEIYRK